MISERWRAFLEEGEQAGNASAGGSGRRLRGKSSTPPKGTCCRCAICWCCATRPSADCGADKDPRSTVPAWVQDYALFLLDVDGQIVAWYAGAERIYGYKSDEVIGQHVSLLYPDEDTLRAKLHEELKRAAGEGHFGTEGWHVKKDGSRFWANVITMALKDDERRFAGLCQSGARL